MLEKVRVASRLDAGEQTTRRARSVVSQHFKFWRFAEQRLREATRECLLPDSRRTREEIGVRDRSARELRKIGFGALGTHHVKMQFAHDWYFEISSSAVATSSSGLRVPSRTRYRVPSRARVRKPSRTRT